MAVLEVGRREYLIWPGSGGNQRPFTTTYDISCSFLFYHQFHLTLQFSPEDITHAARIMDTRQCRAKYIHMHVAQG